MEKKISLIIPCYNVEQYVHACYQSLKKQTFGVEYLEIIFIDDGSTDATWQKLVEIEEDCPDSVMIIKCEVNSRLGTARNIGLEYASAPYVAFVDSDDWVEPDMYEKMYAKAKEYDCDVVCCDYIRDFGEEVSNSTPKRGDKEDRFLLVDSQEKRKKFILAFSMQHVAWNKLMKIELLIENELYFPEKLVYEDNWWGSALYLYASRIFILEEKLYHYRVNMQSIVLKKEQSYYRDLLTVNLLKWQEWENRGLLKTYYEELTYDFLTLCYLGYLKLLILRFRKPSFEEFLLLKKEVLARVPDYQNNPYLTNYFTPFNQLLLNLLKLPVTLDVFEQVVLQAKVKWERVRIYIATDVEFTLPEDTIYYPIQIGKAPGKELPYIGDNTGTHISHLHEYYGELTCIYWIWKNYYTTDYVGICQSDKYFVNDEGFRLKKEDYIRILSEYDVIIVEPAHGTKSCYDMYAEAHNIQDMQAVADAIEKLYPEYLPHFWEVMHGKDIYESNLFVTAKNVWNAYAEWLFEVLREASSHIHPEGYALHQRKVYEFLAEQLLFIWIRANNLACYECSVKIF